MPDLGITLVSAIAAPLGVAVVGALAARSGLGFRLRRLEYLEKRRSLIAGILNQSPSTCTQYQRDALVREYQHIVDSVLTISAEFKEELVLKWDSYPAWRRILTVPRPRTGLGWIGTIIFYLYGFCSVSYLFMVPLMLMRAGRPPDWYLFIAVAGSFLMATLGHIWAVGAARQAVLLEKAKRIIATNATVE